MKLIKTKATTNSLRHILKIEKNLLSKNNKIIKQVLAHRKKNNAGKSSINGRTTVWHKGGGNKKRLRKILLTNQNTNSIVICTCYDPTRKGFINLNFELEKKVFQYNLASDLSYPGSLIKTTPQINELKLGYRTDLKNIPIGSMIHNLSVNTFKQGQYIRSAGTFGQIIERGHTNAKIKLPSKKVIEVPTNAFATLGIVSNINNNRIVIGKAGTKRHMGCRPTVRGIAMNPIDHPHGGRTNGGKPSVTPWGLPTKGKFRLKKR